MLHQLFHSSDGVALKHSLHHLPEEPKATELQLPIEMVCVLSPLKMTSVPFMPHCPLPSWRF